MLIKKVAKMKLWLWVLLGLLVIVVAQMTQKQREPCDDLSVNIRTLIVIVPWIPNHHLAMTMYDNMKFAAKDPKGLICVFGVQNLRDDDHFDTALCRFVQLKKSDDTFVNRLMLLRHLMRNTEHLCGPLSTVMVLEYDPSLVIADQFDSFVLDQHEPNTIWCPNLESLSGFMSLHHGTPSKTTGIPDFALRPWSKHTIEGDTEIDCFLDLRAFVCDSQTWKKKIPKIIDDNLLVANWLVYGDSLWLADLLGMKVYQLYEAESRLIATRTHAYFGRTDWAYHPWILRQKSALAKVQKQLRDTHAWFARVYSKLWTEKPSGTFKS